jgi:hypothetical protein
MSHWGGGGAQKVQKKCHVLFEWPLTLPQNMLGWEKLDLAGLKLSAFN